MDRGPEQVFVQRWYSNGQPVFEKMLSTAHWYKMQIKPRCDCFTSTRQPLSKKKCWWGCREISRYVRRCSLYENIMMAPRKIKNRVTTGSSQYSPLWVYTQKNWNTGSQKVICTPMFIAALHTKGKKWDRSKTKCDIFILTALGLKKEGNSDTSSNMGDPRGPHTK